MIGQTYAQFVRLAAPRGRVPLLLCHGGGMTGAVWESTPDGRPGWQTAFLRDGWDVVILDSVERGRASWAPYPALPAPFFRTAQETWEVFRFGPAGCWHREAAQRRHHPNLRFPLQAFDTFMKQAVPRWAGNEALIQSGYDALLQRLGECCLIAHSQGGLFAMKAAMAAPQRVRAVVLLEPTDAPDAATADAACLQRVPHLFLWGDYMQHSELWSRCHQHVRRWYDALRQAGVQADWKELPALGIDGNSHVMMADSNSDHIAAIVCSWLSTQGLSELSD